MELKHLERFLAVYDLGSLAVAAKSLGLTQQAISSTLANLEESPVFRLTVAGKLLRVSAKFDELYTAAKYGAPPDEPVDAHSVQAYYTLLLAKEADMSIEVDENEERIVFTAS